MLVERFVFVMALLESSALSQIEIGILILLLACGLMILPMGMIMIKMDQQVMFHNKYGDSIKL